jgi:hypothetical protein
MNELDDMAMRFAASAHTPSDAGKLSVDLAKWADAHLRAANAAPSAWERAAA